MNWNHGRQSVGLHIPSRDMGESVVATSVALPMGESEVAKAHLETTPVEGMPLPRVKGPKVALFCVKHKIIEVGTEKQGLILGEIKKIWVDDSLAVVKDGKTFLDPRKLDPLARLGGKDYAVLGDIFPIERPRK